MNPKSKETFLQLTLHKIADLKILPPGINNKLREINLASKINTIILISTLPIFFLLLVAFGMFAYQQNKQIDTAMRESAVATGNVFKYYENQTVMYANTFSNNAVVENQLLSSTPNSGPIVRAGSTIKKSADIDQLTVINKKGEVVARVHAPIRLGDNLLGEAYVKDALEKGKSSKIMVMDHGTPVLQGIVPVIFEGEIIGAVIAGYELNNSFSNMIYRLTRKHVFLVVNDKILASSMGKIKNQESQLYTERNTDFSIIRDIILYNKDNKQEKIAYDIRYVEIDTKLSDKDLNGFGLLIVMDQSGARYYLIFLLTGFVLISLFIIFIALIIALKIAKNIGKSVSHIDNGLKRISGGDLDTQIEIVSQDELGQLAGAFNSMVKDLDSSYKSLESAKQKIQDYAEHLEEKVEERTAELQKTLQEVQALKVQQDGDYYLTSLLTDPLSSNTISPKNTIKADYRLYQKKKFQFKKYQKELGGDLCITHELILNRRPHIFFLNADAMGKSLQGAGGILVLGSVLQSIVERNKLDEQNQTQYPELWMRSTFIELHKVFESFGGSMLISLAMGLIDAESGNMYYMNAEHPWTVLYRDGVASFIENELLYRKIGTQGINSVLYVMLHELHEGDILIAGSDGRDDILLEVKDGVRVLNEDETLFLKAIEKSKGNLDSIIANIKEYGELTDDLSLLKIEFSPVKQIKDTNLPYVEKLSVAIKNKIIKIYENLRENKYTEKELSKALKNTLDLLDNNQVSGVVQDLLTAIPSLPSYLKIITSYLFERGEYKEAMVHSERIRNLTPFDKENLSLLEGCYVYLGEKRKSDKIHSMIEELG